MNAEQHEWYWRGYNDAKESIQSGQLRVWFGLTDEEVITMSRYDLEYAALIGEVQKKLKEKNNG